MLLECKVGITKVIECSCTSNSHCLFDNTECRNGHCQCISGYFAYENGLACREGLLNFHHLCLIFVCSFIFHLNVFFNIFRGLLNSNHLLFNIFCVFYLSFQNFS